MFPIIALNGSKAQSDPPLIGFFVFWVYNIYMSPHEFSKQMKNPYFGTKYYKEETPAGKMETRIELRVEKILSKIFFWRKKKDA